MARKTAPKRAKPPKIRRIIGVLVVDVKGPNPEVVGIPSAAPRQFVATASPQPRKINPGKIASANVLARAARNQNPTAIPPLMSHARPVGLLPMLEAYAASITTERVRTARGIGRSVGVIPEHWPSPEGYLLTILVGPSLELSRSKAAPLAAA
jgi:hypothetical protein